MTLTEVLKILAISAFALHSVSAGITDSPFNDGCFTAGPTTFIDLNQGRSVVGDVCAFFSGSYVALEQRSACAWGTANTKFDFNIRWTGSKPASLSATECANNMNNLLGPQCKQGLGGRTTDSAGWQYT